MAVTTAYSKRVLAPWPLLPMLLATAVLIMAQVCTAQLTYVPKPLSKTTCADLHDAILYAEFMTTVKHLIEVKKCGVNLRRKSDGYMPLHMALLIAGRKGLSHPNSPIQREMITYLLKKGARVTEPFPEYAGITGYTPLHYMSYDANLQYVRLFIDYGANVRARDQRGFTPLHSAARCDFRISSDIGALNTIAYLISRGGDILARTKDNATVLDIVPDPCIASGTCTIYDPRAKKCTDMCTDKGKNWNWPSGTCKAAYFYVKEMMAAATKPKSPAPKPKSPAPKPKSPPPKTTKTCKDLSDAILFDENLTTIKYLIEVKKCGANYKFPDTKWTPLHVALTRSGKNGLSHPYDAVQVDIIKYLLAKGANVRTPFPDYAGITGYTPLHFMSYDGNMILVPLFIKYGANIHARDQRGFTPLHSAARCDFRISCDDCSSPLPNVPPAVRLSKAGARPTIHYLLSKGADILAKTKENLTVLDIVPTPCVPAKDSCTSYDPRAKRCGDMCTDKARKWNWPSGSCQKTYFYVKDRTRQAKAAAAKPKPKPKSG